jgi:hypothetical protein
MEGVLNDLCRAPRVRAEDLYRVLLGLHCAEAAAAAGGASPATGGSGGLRRGARAGAARVARRLAAHGVSFEPAPPPTLTLAAAAILAAHGLHLPGLHGPKGLPAQAARLLATAREGDREDEAGEALMLYDKRLLLHAMGRLPAPWISAASCAGHAPCRSPRPGRRGRICCCGSTPPPVAAPWHPRRPWRAPT